MSVICGGLVIRHAGDVSVIYGCLVIRHSGDVSVIDGTVLFACRQAALVVGRSCSGVACRSGSEVWWHDGAVREFGGRF